MKHATGWRTWKSGKHTRTRRHARTKSWTAPWVTLRRIKMLYAAKIIFVTAVTSKCHRWKILNIKLYSNNIQLQHRTCPDLSRLYQRLIAVHVCDWVIWLRCSARLCNYCNHFSIVCAHPETYRQQNPQFSNWSYCGPQLWRFTSRCIYKHLCSAAHHGQHTEAQALWN